MDTATCGQSIGVRFRVSSTAVGFGPKVAQGRHGVAIADEDLAHIAPGDADDRDRSAVGRIPGQEDLRLMTTKEFGRPILRQLAARVAPAVVLAKLATFGRIDSRQSQID